MNLYDEKEQLFENEGRDIVTRPLWRLDDVIKLGEFIAWHDRVELSSGVEKSDAFMAFCRLAGIKNPTRALEIVQPRD